MAARSDWVFVNCPFDRGYLPLFRCVVFAVHDCGLVARCALEINDSAENRLEKICRIIVECRYGIHDISRTQLDPVTQLPRFNMPFELGLFLGCRRFGGSAQRQKPCLVLDRHPHRYQKFLSGIAGQDIASHGGHPRRAIQAVREWLCTHSRHRNLPGPSVIWQRYLQFRRDLPAICQRLRVQEHELTFVDFSNCVIAWLKTNAA